ncbi:MAG: M48 family metalloprotease [Gemmatimonadetes bacterium]|nr:M48 family metalloprotease [Gemmatimonadota bacterium]
MEQGVVILLVGMAATVVAGLGLAITRRFAGGATEPAAHLARRDQAAFALAVLATSSAALALGGGTLVSGESVGDPPTLVVGLVVGTVFFLFIAIMSATYPLFAWATRRRALQVTPRFLARQVAVNLGVWLGIGVGIVFFAGALPDGWAPWVSIPVVMVAFPLAEHVIKPGLLFPRSVDLAGYRERFPEIEDWTRETAASHHLGRVRLAVIPGELKNAFATGTALSGRWILLGEGLLELMGPRQLRSIVAHEMAHLIRRDVPRMVMIAAVFGSAYAAVNRTLVFPLFDQGNFAWGLLVGGVVGGVVVAWLPGFFVQRIELATDQLGAKLTGDPDASCAALVRLAKSVGRRMDRGTVTHPSMNKRIAAIRATTT